MTSRKYGASVFEVANRIAINNDTDGLAGVADNLADHQRELNNNAHKIYNISGLQTDLNSKANVTHTHTVSDVTGLQTALDGKQSVLTGFTGSFSVVTHVDLPGGAVTTKTITVSNGVIVSVV